MIKQNTRLPCEFIKQFCTVDDDAARVGIKVYEGGRYRSSDNQLLTCLMVDVEQKLAGEEKIWVKFELDVNGTIS